MFIGLLGGALYLYLRLQGVSDEELTPEEYHTDTIDVANGQVVFGGDAKYDSIPLEQLCDVFYEPLDQDFQEVTFAFTEKGNFIYSLNNSVDYIKEAVARVHSSLR
ncbi:hypothetical protein [Pleionea sp. CnH1-48]|uniref:hypothetical protein n=1 Tax=Pleionea sp. CnH1-48 TaxID=2954494 RepID=UPI002096B526|nr:hypothetical protein [Pleionea sp. CnH1-48]MCO7225434.1 hypothetical protein [Pleionea sp. CnH1-48]